MIVFSAYSRIPAPRVKWDGEAMKISIAFLPWVGAVIGLAVWGWQLICRYFGVGQSLFAAGAAALPVFLTGGIHLDGYCDTSDALSSWQDKARRLEILKDPHVGAFAVIRVCLYLLLEFALLAELYARSLDTGFGWVFIISRCFAASGAMFFKKARADGMLSDFTRHTDRPLAGILLAFFSVASMAGLARSAFPQCLAGLALCVPVTLGYRKMAAKYFGGITGDTTGFFLQKIELTLLAGFLIGGVGAEWL